MAQNTRDNILQALLFNYSYNKNFNGRLTVSKISFCTTTLNLHD